MPTCAGGARCRYDSSVPSTDRKYTNQATVYNDLGVDIVKSCFEGFNACLFAYGKLAFWFRTPQCNACGVASTLGAARAARLVGAPCGWRLGGWVGNGCYR